MRKQYFAVAVSLTILDGLIAVYYSSAAWTAWSYDTCARGLLVMSAALEITSLANVWAHAIARVGNISQTQAASSNPLPVRVPAETGGESDV